MEISKEDQTRDASEENQEYGPEAKERIGSKDSRARWEKKSPKDCLKADAFQF